MISQISVKELKISSKINSPEVTLSPQGSIRIKGRWMNGNLIDFSKPIIDWIDSYLNDPADLTSVDINCEYISGNNTVILLSMLRKIIDVRLKNKSFQINWFYEDGDEDILEKGEYISETLKIPLVYKVTTDHAVGHE